MTDVLPLRAEKRRARILEAALSLFLKQGLQGTTMEAIARSAGIAKPTLYSYFPEKVVLLQVLVDDQILARTKAFLEILAGDGDPALLVTTALTDLFGAMADMVEGSPFATELLGESRRPSLVAAECSQAIVDALSTVLGRLGFVESKELSSVLLASGTGILGKYVGGRSVRDAMMLLCSSMLGGRTSGNF